MIVTQLTPPGRSALASLALTGPGAWELASRLFRPRSGRLPQPGCFALGALGEGLAEEVVLARLSDDLVEVHCHGGREASRLVLEALTSQGARPGPLPHASRARRMLPYALTARTAGILLDQMASPTGDPARYAHVGAHLVTPWRVAVLGPPNAGKSSLVNALAGFQRCITSPVAGTTRDVVGVVCALDGWPAELLDTAGVREAQGLEAEGVALALQAAATCDLCLWVVDPTAEPALPPPGLTCILKVSSKCDLALGDGIRTSARTGEGLEELSRAIVTALIPEPPPPNAAVALPEEAG
jgi:tRNA modification GTPase